MNKVEIPSAASVAGWNGEKAALAKDKAVASKLTAETTKLTDAIKAFEAAAGKVDFSLGETKGLASAAAGAAAIAQLEEARKGAVKNAMGAAKLAAAAADTFAAAAQKAEKGLPAASAKVVVAAKSAAAAASKAADKYASDLSSAVDAAIKELQAAAGKLGKAGEKDKKPEPPKLSPKALADGKNLAALMRKSIALLRTPKGAPLPVKFMVLYNKANPKDLRLYLGPKPESGLAKLKTQFPAEVKVNRVKDPKGKVVWDKGALTFMSDILKGGLAKQIQLSIRQQTKVTVKVRIKKSSGEVDEADAKDVSDDELALSPAEEAAMVAGGKEWESGLKELDSAIQAALKGAKADQVKKLVAGIRSAGGSGKFDAAADGLDELASLLQEADVADSDGKDLESDTPVAGPGEKGVDPATALKAKFEALRGKIDAAIALKDAASKEIKQFKDGAEQFLKKTDKAAVENAGKFVTKIEQLLANASKPKSTLPVAKLETARANFVKSRDTTIKEITRLSKAIVTAFAAEASQKAAVTDAIKKLGELQIKLQTGLERELSMAIKAKDPDKQADLVDRVKDSLQSFQDFLDSDDLMKNLDKNEVLQDMSVVGPMKTSLKEIEAALG
ncbi:MAG: hypothetical protein K8R60_23955 [Burkholderiales bacterium]|nr:hypothetical protein [Burkholderiales bacterium]